MFIVLSVIVIAGFLGDKYFEYVRRHRQKTRKQDDTNKRRTSTKETWTDPDRQEALTKVVRRAVERKHCLA